MKFLRNQFRYSKKNQLPGKKFINIFPFFEKIKGSPLWKKLRHMVPPLLLKIRILRVKGVPYGVIFFQRGSSFEKRKNEIFPHDFDEKKTLTHTFVCRDTNDLIQIQRSFILLFDFPFTQYVFNGIFTSIQRFDYLYIRFRFVWFWNNTFFWINFTAFLTTFLLLQKNY